MITNKATTGSSRKLFPKYITDVFRVCKVLINDQYEVEDLRVYSRRLEKMISTNHIKKYIIIEI